MNMPRERVRFEFEIVYGGGDDDDHER